MPLDTSIFQVAGDLDVCWGVATQADGKVVMVGNGAGPDGVDGFLVVRLNADGALDTTFNGTGKLALPLAPQGADAESVTLDAQGRILVAGFAQNPAGTDIQFALLRLNTDGTLDTTLNGTGSVLLSAGSGDDYCTKVAVQSDGRILLAGYDGSDISVARLNADGTVDSAFGGGKGYALVTVPGGQGNDTVHALAVQADGKILVGESVAGATSSAFLVARLNTDGTLDAGFGTGGSVTLADPAGDETLQAIAVQADGRILVGGSLVDAHSDSHPVVLRLMANGSLDPTFNGTGKAALAGIGSVNDLAVMTDGRIVLGMDLDGHAAAGVLHADGTPDATVAGTGVMSSAWPVADSALDLDLRADGTFLLGGYGVVDGIRIGFSLATGSIAAGGGTGQGVNGSGSSDLLHGTAGSDVIDAKGGNDVIFASAHGDAIDGGTGIDTVVFTGAAAGYFISEGEGGWAVEGAASADFLAGVERLQFDDVHVALDISGDAGEAYRLYRAAFDRAPDLPGLGFQMKALDDGWGISAIARNFIDSPEFQATYGALDDTQFVTQLYANVLDRAPDAAGLAYHLARLGNGVARADILVGFSESPENQAAVIGSIAHGMEYSV